MIYMWINNLKEKVLAALSLKWQKRARELGVRMIVLETQSSNFPAIQFYLKNGFQLIGLNVNSYSNEDIKKRKFASKWGAL